MFEKLSEFLINHQKENQKASIHLQLWEQKKIFLETFLVDCLPYLNAQSLVLQSKNSDRNDQASYKDAFDENLQTIRVEDIRLPAFKNLSDISTSQLVWFGLAMVMESEKFGPDFDRTTKSTKAKRQGKAQRKQEVIETFHQIPDRKDLTTHQQIFKGWIIKRQSQMTLPSKVIDIDAYFLNFLRPNAVIPISPLPNSIIVAGSGTGDEPDVYDPLPPKETLLPTPAINIPPTVVFSPY